MAKELPEGEKIVGSIGDCGQYLDAWRSQQRWLFAHARTHAILGVTGYHSDDCQ